MTTPTKLYRCACGHNWGYFSQDPPADTICTNCGEAMLPEDGTMPPLSHTAQCQRDCDAMLGQIQGLLQPPR